MNGKALQIKWTERAEIAPCGLFTYAHQHGPSGFNPSFKPYAKDIMNKTYQSLESEGVYKNMTLKERQEKNVFRKRYDQLMREYESQHGI